LNLNPKIAASVFLILAGISFAQQKTYEDVNYRKFSIFLNASDTVLSLPDKFLMSGTVTVYSDSAAISRLPLRQN
jgi:hypothetical protein